MSMAGRVERTAASAGAPRALEGGGLDASVRFFDLDSKYSSVPLPLCLPTPGTLTVTSATMRVYQGRIPASPAIARTKML